MKTLRQLLVLAVAAAGVLSAQDPPARVGRLNYISGPVSFQPGGVSDWVPAALNRPLTAGDQIYVDSGSRAEIHIPGAAFHLGSQTAFEFLNLDDSNTQVRLSEGALNIRVRALDGNFEIDTPNQAFTISRPGEYRIDANPDAGETFVTVRNGEGQVTGNGGAFLLRAGEQADIAGQDQQARYNVYAAPDYDEFDNWSSSRDRREDRLASSRYVSPSVVGYEDLDDYGDWRSMPGYGQCWIPRGMPAGWAPYHAGHWAWIDPWGWTWVDDQPWGFAPFHYGRWAYFDGFWGWVPGPVAVRPVYAPALVAWVGLGGGFSASFRVGGGPSVGWFPLGPRDVYVPAYRTSPTYVTRINTTNTTVINNIQITNVYNNYVRTGSVSTTNYMNRSVRGAVVAVPQNALTSSRPVQQVAVAVPPNQMTDIRSFNAAPAVAPERASVLGHSQSMTTVVARPSAAVLSRPVVARTTPPPPPPSFQQRQTALAENRGRPLTMQQQAQIAQSAPAAGVEQPPVRVVTQARQVTPTVSNAQAPRQPQRQVQPQAQPQRAEPRAYEPPQQQQPQRQVQPQAQPQRVEPRSYEPPQQQQPPRQVQPQTQPQRVEPRAYEPPQQQQPRRQVQPQTQPQRAEPRSYEPPRVQQRPAQSQPHPQAQPPREQPRQQPDPQRRPAPPPKEKEKKENERK